ncbi:MULTISPECIES: hypothetical protein [Paenibacillus]|uniref:hypothetical protein n=1 Tax=Paenibacillus TaxID=44249 RepID=UPI0012F98ABA|nr:hypothetical protein [Paenibacillus sp. IHBB 10380]
MEQSDEHSILLVLLSCNPKAKVDGAGTGTLDYAACYGHHQQGGRLQTIYHFPTIPIGK